jgi:hypothetical protein
MSLFRDSCPGSREIRQPSPEELKCRKCHRVVEIWSDETEAKCKHCGTINYRNMPPTCIEWCAFAKECVGEEKYRKLKSKGKEK